MSDSQTPSFDLDNGMGMDTSLHPAILPSNNSKSKPETNKTNQLVCVRKLCILLLKYLQA